MKVILYMAISTDGYIAKENDDTNWVTDTDWGVFSKIVKDAGCIIMGRRTYEASGDAFPYNCKLNIVLTSDKKLHKETSNTLFTSKKPRQVIKIAEDKGFKKVLIIGGGNLNASFLKEKLIDEIYLSVHPKILVKGIKIFEGEEMDVNLKLLSVKKLTEDLVQLHY